MKRLANDPILKRQLISRYLWPGLGLAFGPDHPVTADFAQAGNRYEVIKYEHFEITGPYRDGQAYLFEHALSHSYFHYADTGEERGIAIHRPHELIFQGESLLYADERFASLQALEPGGVLAIPYPALKQLMGAHGQVNAAVEAAARRQQRSLNQLGRFLGMPAEQRFKRFRERHHPLLHRLPHHIQAMHINISRTQLSRYIKKEAKTWR
ncbi:MAG TPA: hypothetical protein VNQ80_08190 [Parapedobacter sp.]|uniref:Crp/Fnr family transcriptional regulator n=1 Tax=Parapedobacter sp. TaxID=1958893 RepID=UPI002CF51C06|nr:hypothetical protein [Parapedobacter sp.]HWK57301.1 hypothetical protein [Parapedobacter sp.]